MTDQLAGKLSQLPHAAGIYYHLDSNNQIIYVGKATNLRQRVRQYFHHPQSLKLSPKDIQLRIQISDVKWRVTDNALQALFLESEMIKRYQPKYNVLSRNPSFDNWYYLGFNFQPANPHLIITRSIAQLEDYDCLGPYLEGAILKKILKYLRKNFPFSTHKKLPPKACLDYHLGLCPGPETDKFEASVAVANLKALKTILKGNQRQLIIALKQDMHKAATNLEFEVATKLRNQIQSLRDFRQSLVFKDLSSLNASGDQALEDLQALMNLKHPLARIETYDISHISGSYTTASMIVAQNGIVQPALSRRFKSHLAGNNDIAQIEDIIKRRFQMKSLKHLKPDLIIIDGGRGQVSAVIKALRLVGQAIAVIGLAKKKEQIVLHNQTDFNNQKLIQLKGEAMTSVNFTIINLPHQTDLIKLMQRLRDASHRKAVQYHNQLMSKAQITSELLNLPMIGPKTYQKLIKQFGSVANMNKATDVQLATILNTTQLKVVRDYLKTCS